MELAKMWFCWSGVAPIQQDRCPYKRRKVDTEQECTQGKVVQR